MSHRIGTIYYGEQHTRIRVFTAAVDQVADMLEAGISLNEALDAVRAQRGVY